METYPYPTWMLRAYSKLLRPLRLLLTPAVRQTSFFLGLPVEILCNICDKLPLSAKMSLSYTCKAVWYILYSECSSQLEALVQADRFDTLTELGNLLPDNYHCIKCNNLHRVQPDDVPDLTNWYRRRHPCRTTGNKDDLVCPHDSYRISFHHVQLALKYSRMKGKHQDCRTNILKKFKICPVDSPLIKTFAAEPKVINAGFVLLATYVLHAGPLRESRIRDPQKHIMFCPHQHFGVGTGLAKTFAVILQQAAIRASTTHDQQTELFSCDRCQTDYSVMVQEHEAVVKVWYDLGNGSSVNDPSWQKHLYSENNRIAKGSRFSYEHGSISKMYDSC